MTELLRRRRALMGQKSGPATVHGTWEDLFRCIGAGTYATEYALGEILPLDLGTEGMVNAQIVAFNADDKSDGSGKAKITFITQYCLNTSRRFNPTLSGSSGNYTEGTGTIGGWNKSELRTYIKGTIKPLIPSAIRSRIVSVTKYSKSFDTTGTVVANDVTVDDVWIPNVWEMNGDNRFDQTSGVTYKTVFSTLGKRKKTKAGSTTAIKWRVRSAYSTTHAFVMTEEGAPGGQTVAISAAAGIVIGFCID